MADWSTRTGTPEDASAVLALWRSASGPASVTDTRAALVALLRRHPDGLVLADRGGIPIGSLIAVWDGWRGNFYRLAVSPEHRREGIATALVREGERRLLSLGAARLAAVVATDDPVAMDFWRGVGYRWQADQTRFVRDVKA